MARVGTGLVERGWDGMEWDGMEGGHGRGWDRAGDEMGWIGMGEVNAGTPCTHG